MAATAQITKIVVFNADPALATCSLHLEYVPVTDYTDTHIKDATGIPAADLADYIQGTMEDDGFVFA
jgi:hypothetical protein